MIVSSFVASFLLLVGTSVLAEEAAECRAHSLRVEEVKERLKRWQGLAAFNRWRIVDLSLDPCVLDGKVAATLGLAATEGWSSHSVTYKATLVVVLDGASGAPLSQLANGWRRFPTAGKQFIQVVEAAEVVRGFLERYPPVEGELAIAAATGRFQVAFRGTFEAERFPSGVPQLTFAENSPGRVISYRVPRVDGLPVRRELLRFAEVLTLRHPNCFPSWIDARRTPPTGNPDEEFLWNIEANLRGENCPSCFSLVVGPNGATADPGAIDEIPIIEEP